MANYALIKGAHITEKAVQSSEKNRQYVFSVAKNANKTQIKAAIESFFGVVVDSVRTINMLGKNKNFRQKEGRRSDWKKAYVALSEGHEINLLNLNK